MLPPGCCLTADNPTLQRTPHPARSNLAPQRGQENIVCEIHRALGPFNWHDPLFWAHCFLAELFQKEREFDDAHVHIKRARPYAANDAHNLDRAIQSKPWFCMNDVGLKRQNRRPCLRSGFTRTSGRRIVRCPLASSPPSNTWASPLGALTTDLRDTLCLNATFFILFFQRLAL